MQNGKWKMPERLKNTPMTYRLFIVLLIVSLLAGCTVGPKYNRPSVATPTVFRGAADPTAPPDAHSLADLKWFELFKDSQLQELINTASTQNYDIREAVARVSAARAQLGITRAEQFPDITGTADITKQRNSTKGSFPLPPGVSRDRTFGTVLLNLLSFEIDVWGRLRKQTEAAHAQLQASEEDRKTVMTTLVSDVATSYFNLLELDLELDIAKQTLATRQNSLQLIKVRQQGGVATMLDVRQAEQLVYSASQEVPDVERQIEQTENRISLLLGKNPGAIVRGRALGDQEHPPSVPPGLPSALLERRPDIRSAEQTLIAANAQIGVARAAYFPTISLTGFLGTQSDQLSSLFTNPASTWSFVPRITQPIFTAGRIKSKVKLTQAQREIALIDYERIIQTAFREVSDALVQYRKVREIRAQQDLLVTTLEDRSRLAYLRYRGGVDTLLNALDADRDLFNAQLSLAQTKRNELLSLVQLYKALGGGWQQ
jgi:multidrug efflux system outer membrane protein